MFIVLWRLLPWGRAVKLCVLVTLAAALVATLWWGLLPWLDEVLYGDSATPAG